MISNFPRQFANKAIALYFAVLLGVSLLFVSNSMNWYWMVFGAVEVCSFCYFSSVLPIRWSRKSDEGFEKALWNTSLYIRLSYVVLSFFFYKLMTGTPFEFYAADSLVYDAAARGVANTLLGHGLGLSLDFWGMDFSDRGYPFFLGVFYALSWKSIIVSRVIKAFISSWTVVLLYRLSYRCFGGGVARLGGIFCMLMPNLIYYCGMTLKEVEMVFLCLLFMERADYALRAMHKVEVKAWIIPILSAVLLFAFRTAVGLIAFLSLGAAILFSSEKVVTRWQKWALGSILAIGLVTSVGSQALKETAAMWEDRGGQQSNMEWRSERANGNRFAKYAGASVFAPLIFTIPFPTVVDIPGQENQQMIHGGNYVKNVISLFVILALFILIFSGDWRMHVLPFSFLCGYLVVLVFSNFAQSERFHLPVLPLELMFAAYAVIHLKAKHIRYYNVWLFFLFIVNVAWSWFKLRGRGLA